MVANTVRAKGLDMLCWIDPALPASLFGDPTRIRQVLTILVENAIKFTRAGEVAVRVELQGESAGVARARIAVTDTGIGIEPEARRRMFDAFWQADGSMSRSHGGTGLGLAICRQLVELMGGQIGVESEVGAGSTFWLTLGLPRAGLPVSSTGSRRFPLPAGLECPEVIAVDASAAVRAMLHQQLAAWGVPCATAGDLAGARRALEAWGEGAQRIVLVDEELVGRDREGFRSLLEERRALEGLRVVFMSWPREQAASAETGAAGPRPDATLEKPVRPSDLFDGIVGLARVSPHRAAPGGGLEPRAGTPEGAGVAGVRVLVAEDNPVNQLVVRRILEKGGYACSMVENGEEAVTALAAERFDVVLMDCQMPGVDGFQATRRIRALERAAGDGRRAVIIALTANAMASDRRRCLDAGMDDYLSKPVTPDLLLNKLRTVVARSGGAGHEPPPALPRGRARREDPGLTRRP